MKALVFGGSGKIGSAVAWDLAKDKDIKAIGITGRRKDKLEKVKQWTGSDRIVPHVLDVNDKEAAIKLMKEYDVGISAMPDRRTSYRMIHFAIEAGLLESSS